MAGPTSNAPPIAGTNGGDIAQQLMQLVEPILQSPKGQAMAQALMSQLGGGGGDPRVALAEQDIGPPYSLDQVPPGRTRANFGPGPMGDGVDESAMSTEQELEMARQMMGNANMSDGGTGPGSMNPNAPAPSGEGGLNQSGPTPEEIKMLQSAPTERNVRNFMKLFGEQAAIQALSGGGSGGSYEDDVRASMKEPEPGHGLGHRGRGEPLDGTILDDDD